MPRNESTIPDLWMQFYEEEIGESGTLPLPKWPRLTDLSGALRPGCVCLIGGPQNTGKSFFCTLIALAVHRMGETWRYLPLEDNRTDFMRRILAILSESYRIIDDDQSAAKWRGEKLREHKDQMKKIEMHVSENPRRPVDMGDGDWVVPRLNQSDVLKWLKVVLPLNRVVFIDPTTQIEFEGREKWRAEEDFIHDFLGLVAAHRSTLVMVMHTKNLSGMRKNEPLTAEHLQGTSLWAKLCHCTLLLESHEEKDSTIVREGYDADRLHNRTVTIARTRNAGGSKKRLAFIQDNAKPAFEEIGVISPKKRPKAAEG